MYPPSDTGSIAAAASSVIRHPIVLSFAPVTAALLVSLALGEKPLPHEVACDLVRRARLAAGLEWVR